MYLFETANMVEAFESVDLKESCLVFDLLQSFLVEIQIIPDILSVSHRVVTVYDSMFILPQGSRN